MSGAESLDPKQEPLVLRLDEIDRGRIAQAGGKGANLGEMVRAGLDVPTGFVLTAACFQRWLDALRSVPEWPAFLVADAASLPAACAALKVAAGALPLDDEQRAAIDLARAGFPADALIAVRSSSPEEDLEGSSFAGGYETVLGVTLPLLEAAVRRAFVSCLDERVVSYKRAHGFDVTRPRIAVVLQRQIASDVAGVGFSIDPRTNDYDEGLFAANFGLGETVVAGTASPDEFIVDKVARRIVRRARGGKETSVWLEPGGGTREAPAPRREELCLSDEQVLALTDLLLRVEAHYGCPMDIEWAFAGGALFLLQARPITTHLQLPDELVTRPGARRRLYLDISISVQGLFDPISVAGTDLLTRLPGAVTRLALGRDLSVDVDQSIAWVVAGRLYANLSNIFTLAGKDSVARAFHSLDPLTAETIATVDEATYRALRPPLSAMPLRALAHLYGSIARMVQALLAPSAARHRLQQELTQAHAELRAIGTESRLLAEAGDRLIERVVRLVAQKTAPRFVAAKVAMAFIRRLYATDASEVARDLDALERALPGNVTVEMGLALDDLSRSLPTEATTGAAITAALSAGTLPQDFVAGWAAFLERYGHRGPRELDAGEPRFREDPRLLLDQIATLRRLSDDSPERPRARHEQAGRDRSAAFSSLLARAHSFLRSLRLRRLRPVVEELGGLRETHKFYAIVVVDLIRQRVRAIGRALVAAGRLDRESQAFDLRLADLDRAGTDAALDLRALGAARRAPADRLARVKALPTIIDSRGRIHRPPPPTEREGVIVGLPVSAGVARGKVVVLMRPDEKPLLPGDVLVARATDPGWTPLFVNAAAVVLEVGGVLQHGALVAREYGKPCVTGVAGATTRLRDGMMIEVDGGTGTITLLDPAPTPTPTPPDARSPIDNIRSGQ